MNFFQCMESIDVLTRLQFNLTIANMLVKIHENGVSGQLEQVMLQTQD